MQKDSLGGRIKERRRELGLSQEKLAEVLFITQATLSKYENDSSEIPSGALLNISKALNTTPNYLLLGEDEEDDFICDLINAGRRLRSSFAKKVAINQIKALGDTENEI